MADLWSRAILAAADAAIVHPHVQRVIAAAGPLADVELRAHA